MLTRKNKPLACQWLILSSYIVSIFIANYFDGILTFYDFPSTGPLEGTNNKISTMKRKAYGFRDDRLFKLKNMALQEVHAFKTNKLNLGANHKIWILVCYFSNLSYGRRICKKTSALKIKDTDLTYLFFEIIGKPYFNKIQNRGVFLNMQLG